MTSITFRRFTAGVAALLLAAAASAQNKKTVHLSGTIKNMNNKLEVVDISAVGELSAAASDRFFIPDSTGHFEITFNLGKPNYFRVGRNILYLSPGDNLTADLDNNKPEAAKFSGTHAEENTYLTQTPFPKAGSFIVGGKNIKPSVTETINYVVAAGKARQQALGACQHVSPVFRMTEEGRIKADVLNSLNMMPEYYGIKPKLKGDSLKALWTECDKQSAPYYAQYAGGLTQPDLIDLVVYRDVLDVIKKYNKPQAISQRVKDYEKADSLFLVMKHTGDKAVIKPMRAQLNTVKYPDYRNALLTSYKYFTGFGKGDKAIDIVAHDPDGKSVHLSDFKGKVIVADFWATWCGPCLQLMPTFDKLRTRYKDDPNVVFVSLSIDNNTAVWKSKLTQSQMTGDQLVITAENMPDYAVKEIPRVILIDKNFVIADMKAPLPGPGLDKAIQTLLKQ